MIMRIGVLLNLLLGPNVIVNYEGLGLHKIYAPEGIQTQYLLHAWQATGTHIQG